MLADGVDLELSDEDTARASAVSARMLARLRELVDFVGQGRPLTKTGNVTLADARSLLETGDEMDGAIGDRVFKTVSAADLPGSPTVVRVARKARFARTVRGKLLSTKAGRELGRDPLADLQRVVAAVDEAGMCGLRHGDDGHLDAALAPFEEVELPFAYWEQAENRRALVHDELTTAVELLEWAGVLVWDSETETISLGTTRRTGGTVRATPAGRWTLYHHLTEEHGVPLGTVRPPAHTEGGFVELIDAVEHDLIEGRGHPRSDVRVGGRSGDAHVARRSRHACGGAAVAGRGGARTTGGVARSRSRGAGRHLGAGAHPAGW